MKNTDQLIQQIMNEVKDESLRDALLKKIIQDETATSSPESDPATELVQSKSLLINELNNLGLEVDEEAAKDLVKFGAKGEVASGNLAGGIFTVMGGLLCLTAVFSGALGELFHPGRGGDGRDVFLLFVGAGILYCGLYFFEGTKKMKRALKMDQE